MLRQGGASASSMEHNQNPALACTAFVRHGYSFPQRQRGFSPLTRAMAKKATPKTTTDAIQSPKCPLESRSAAAVQSKTKKTAYTTHPCHAQGNPQPQPYFLAGNHICFSFVSIINLLLSNAECSHAGPLAFECNRDALPALAGAIGWTEPLRGRVVAALFPYPGV